MLGQDEEGRQSSQPVNIAVRACKAFHPVADQPAQLEERVAGKQHMAASGRRQIFSADNPPESSRGGPLGKIGTCCGLADILADIGANLAEGVIDIVRLGSCPKMPNIAGIDNAKPGFGDKLAQQGDGNAIFAKGADQVKMRSPAPLRFQFPEKPGARKVPKELAGKIVEVAFPFHGVGGIEAGVSQGDEQIGQGGE